MATHSLTRTCAHLPSFSSARIFLQIAPRHLHTSTPLDFLLPSIPATLHRQLPLPLTPRSHIIKAKTQTRGQRRAFTAAAVTQQTRTKVLENPKIDEDGQEMSIEITPRASNRLKQIMAKDGNPALALRIQVESGGCHGFQYLMSLTTLPPNSAAPEDTVFGVEGARVVMDEPSLDLLKGSKVDFTMELIGSQFKIVDNPLATSSCGCGTSFDIKG